MYWRIVSDVSDSSDKKIPPSGATAGQHCLQACSNRRILCRLLFQHALFHSIYDHLGGHTGDDEAGKPDQRADKMEIFQNLVDTGRKQHDYKVDEDPEEEGNDHGNHAVLGGGGNSGGDDTGAGDQRGCQYELAPTFGEIAVDQDKQIGYLKQDHYEFDEFPIIDVVCMGNEKLWSLHKEREYLYSKADLTPEEDDRANDIEELFGDAGGYTMEADAAKLLVGLGIPEDKHFEPLSSLTGGFKLRVLLAQVLFFNPDILLLDEPTNHLDIASIDWLCGFLCNHKGTLIVISHNRYFLNQVCTYRCYYSSHLKW